jgi:hypothetical protein
MQRTRKVSVFLMAGLLLIGAGIFANEIGLTLNAGWGKARIAILVLGLLVGLFPWLPWKKFAAGENRFRAIRSCLALCL